MTAPRCPLPSVQMLHQPAVGNQNHGQPGQANGGIEAVAGAGPDRVPQRPPQSRPLADRMPHQATPGPTSERGPAPPVASSHQPRQRSHRGRQPRARSDSRTGSKTAPGRPEQGTPRARDHPHPAAAVTAPSTCGQARAALYSVGQPGTTRGRRAPPALHPRPGPCARQQGHGHPAAGTKLARAGGSAWWTDLVARSPTGSAAGRAASPAAVA